jgi:hypothetical protein
LRYAFGKKIGRRLIANGGGAACFSRIAALLGVFGQLPVEVMGTGIAITPAATLSFCFAIFRPSAKLGIFLMSNKF